SQDAAPAPAPTGGPWPAGYDHPTRGGRGRPRPGGAAAEACGHGRDRRSQDVRPRTSPRPPVASGDDPRGPAMRRFVLDCSVAVEDMSALVGLGRDHALSAYDAAYLHLALQEHLPLATRDRALRAAARSAGVAPFVTR